MAENCPNLAKRNKTNQPRATTTTKTLINLLIHEAEKTLKTIKPRKFTSRYKRAKLLKTKNSERISKATREKRCDPQR